MNERLFNELGKCVLDEMKRLREEGMILDEIRVKVSATCMLSAVEVFANLYELSEDHIDTFTHQVKNVFGDAIATFAFSESE